MDEKFMVVIMSTLLAATVVGYSSIALGVLYIFGIQRGRAFTKSLLFWSVISTITGVAGSVYLTQ